MKGRRTLWVAGTNDRAELWQKLVAELLTDGDPARVGKVPLRGAAATDWLRPGLALAAN